MREWLEKILKGRHVAYCLLIAAYVALFYFQINQPPFERYPGWDMFWGNVLQAGKLSALKQALSGFELPAVNPYVNFGWNNSGDTTLPQHFLLPLNWLILAVPAEAVIALRTLFFMLLGGLGSYFYLRRICGDSFIAFSGALSYLSLPFIIGLSLYYSILNTFMLLPCMLLAIHGVTEGGGRLAKLVFVLVSFFSFASGDIFVAVIMPPLALVYSFALALRQGPSVWGAALGSLKLFFICLLCGAFYLAPLVDNILEIASFRKLLGEIIPSLHQGGMDLRGFWKFFKQFGGESVYKPNEGSALLLYAPLFLYVACAVQWVLGGLSREDGSREAVAAQKALLAFAALMFLGPALMYSIPALAKTGNGVLRCQMNALPFVMVLAGYIALSRITALTRWKMLLVVATVAAACFGVEYALFVRNVPYDDGYLFRTGHIRFYYWTPCSNQIWFKHLTCVLKDLYPLLPLANFIALSLLAVYSLARVEYERRWALRWFLLTAVVLSALFDISLHNELRLRQARWQIAYRSPYRISEYRARRVCLSGLLHDRDDPNYRTLFVGKAFDAAARNWKLIAETELNTELREDALFAYRETMHPYAALLYYPLAGYSEVSLPLSNLMPPFASKIGANLQWLKLLGVKRVVSADEKIESPGLEYKGVCSSPDSPDSKILGTDGGALYAYEVKAPLSTAFLASEYRVAAATESLKMLYEAKRYPWTESEVWLERPPADEPKTQFQRGAAENFAKLEKLTFGSMRVKGRSSQGEFLVLSRLYSQRWRVYLNGRRIPIYRAYGGFMCIQPPAGEWRAEFRYVPWDVYAGILLSLLAVVFVIV